MMIGKMYTKFKAKTSQNIELPDKDLALMA